MQSRRCCSGSTPTGAAIFIGGEANSEIEKAAAEAGHSDVREAGGAAQRWQWQPTHLDGKAQSTILLCWSIPQGDRLFAEIETSTAFSRILF